MPPPSVPYLHALLGKLFVALDNLQRAGFTKPFQTSPTRFLHFVLFTSGQGLPSLGRNTYIDLQVAPTGPAWPDALANAKLKTGPKLWRVDAKAILSKTGGKPLYKIRPLMKPSAMQHIQNALLGDPSMKQQRPSLLTDQDLILFLDGRMPQNTEAWVKEVAKRRKLDKNLWQDRKPAGLRLLYSNKEFEAGGYAAPSRRSKGSTWSTRDSVPDPLETCTLLKPKQCCLEEKPRRHVDLPGTNRDRGWAGQELKSEEERLLTRLPKEVLDKLLPGELSAEDALDVSGSEEENAEEACDKPAEDPWGYIFPWEASEKQSREMLHCFTHPQTVLVVDFHASPLTALAACRDRKSYCGFCATEGLRTVIYEQLLLKIILDMILGAADGFSSARRHLSRASSLGGNEAPDAGMPSPLEPSSSASVADASMLPADVDEEEEEDELNE